MYIRGTIETPHTDLVFLEGNVVIGATGAVGTVKGDFSFTRTGVGAYSLVITSERFFRYITGGANFIAASGSGIASVEITNDVQAAVKAGTAITIQCYDFAGLAADPASGSVLGVFAFVRPSGVTHKGA
jgi:hypothetical protein